MNPTPCPQCHSINLASALVCVNCGRRMGAAVPPAPPPPPRAASAPPPMGGTVTHAASGPPTSTTASVPENPIGRSGPPAPPTPLLPGPDAWVGAVAAPRTRSHTPLLALVVVALVATSAVAFALTRGSGGELPDSIDGVPRMHTAEANAFEHVMDGMTMADMSLSGAMYGDGETPDLVLELISGVPAEARSVPMDVFFSQAGAGLAANSGGSVREDEAVEATDGGVEYRCAPLDLPPGAPGEAGTGVLCMWKAQDIGIVVTFRTGDPSAAVEDARLAYAAVG